MKEVRVKESSLEIYIGLGLALSSLILLFVVIPAEVGEVKKALVSPKTLPNFLGELLLILSLFLSVGGWLKKGNENQKVYVFVISNLKLVAVSILAIAGYIIALDHIGYLFTSALFLFGLMFIFGRRQYVSMTVFAVALPAVILVFFDQLMKIKLP